MSGKSPESSLAESTTFRAQVRKQIHPGLRVDAELILGQRDRGIIFGPSGAGKSTLLRLIAGLQRPETGQVRLGGETLFDSATKTNVKLRDRQIGMIFQSDLLFPHLNVERNIHFGLHEWDRSQADARMKEVASLCGVEHLLKRFPSTLSGGERQRVGLARALAPRPRLLLCDEPVSALDLENRHELVERLKRVQEAEAIPMLYVTHSPAEAMALGTWLFAVSQGRIVDQGPPLDALARQGGIIASELASALNSFTARITDSSRERGEIRAQIAHGPEVILPWGEWPSDGELLISIRADEILLARGLADYAQISARNRIPAVVERIVAHGGDAEIVANASDTTWIISVVSQTVEALGLESGVEVVMIMKSRSFRVLATS